MYLSRIFAKRIKNAKERKIFMPGKKGKIIQCTRGNFAIYLSDVVRMFRYRDDGIRLATKDFIVSVNKEGNVTNGKRLYKILNMLYEREHRRV